MQAFFEVKAFCFIGRSENILVFVLVVGIR